MQNSHRIIRIDHKMHVPNAKVRLRICNLLFDPNLIANFMSYVVEKTLEID